VWNVVAALEGNKEVRQAAAAIESFRNEMVRAAQVALLTKTAEPVSLIDITPKAEDDGNEIDKTAQ